MPTLVTCRNRGLLEKEWNAASDDFVIPAVGSIVFNLFRYSKRGDSLLASWWASVYFPVRTLLCMVQNTCQLLATTVYSV